MIKDKKYQGFLYIIQNQNGLVKIGSSVFPEQRIAYLENQGGFKSVNKYISDPIWGHENIEKELHKIFHSDRIIGEWFSTPFDDIKKKIQENDWLSEKTKTNVDKKQRPLNIKRVVLFKKENGIYAVRINNVKVRSLKTKSKIEAEQIYKSITKIVKTGKQHLTISELYNEYILSNKNSRLFLTSGTTETLKKIIEAIVEVLGDIEITYLNQDRFNQVFGFYDKEGAKKIIKNLKVLFYFGEQKGLIKNIPDIDINYQSGAQNANIYL